MTNIQILQHKFSEIQKYLLILENYKDKNQLDLLSDLTLRGAVERYLYLLCQATIDFAEALVSYLNLRRPATYGEIFDILHEKSILSPQTSHSLRKMVGFRNILAHAYGDINLEILIKVMHEDLGDFYKLISEVQGKIPGL